MFSAGTGPVGVSLPCSAAIRFLRSGSGQSTRTYPRSVVPNASRAGTALRKGRERLYRAGTINGLTVRCCCWWPAGPGPAGRFGSAPCGSDKAQVVGHGDDQPSVAVAWAWHADHHGRVVVGPAQPQAAAKDRRDIVLAGCQHRSGLLHSWRVDWAFTGALEVGAAVEGCGNDQQGAVAAGGADGAEGDYEVLGEHQLLLPALA